MTSDQQRARENMIEQQIRPWEVLDPAVLDTFRRVPRDRFVPETYRNVAYTDTEIPIGEGERMMKPVIEGRLLQALALTGSERVLEIGTGSGYLTACLAQLSAQVTSVERHASLAESAKARLAAFDVDNVRLIHADALSGFEPAQHYDAIAVTAAVVDVPKLFLDWLAPNGRLFVVKGCSPAMEAVLLSRVDGSHVHHESLFETDLPYLHGAAPQPSFVL